MAKVEAILFDLDGTMWDSSEGVLHAWNNVLQKHPECKRGLLTAEELNSCFGLPMTDIAKKIFTNCTLEEQQDLMDACCVEENAYLYEHGAVLYPDLEKTLLELKKQYKLFVVSNCQSGYIESFIHAHHLEACFDDIECWGNNLLPKGENNKLIMKRNGVTKAVYVGDTTGDEESARVAGIPFVYAAYGFGEAKAPDYVIHSFKELTKIMEQVTV